MMSISPFLSWVIVWNNVYCTILNLILVSSNEYFALTRILHMIYRVIYIYNLPLAKIWLLAISGRYYVYFNHMYCISF